MTDHSDVPTMLKHYTVLGVEDIRKAVATLPRILPPDGYPAAEWSADTRPDRAGGGTNGRRGIGE